MATVHRPSSGWPVSSEEAKNATPSPEPIGNSPLRAIAARAYGSMSDVPVFGHAVQAPIVVDPHAVPGVNANCVRPRPKAAATANENKNPISRRIGPLSLASIAAGAVFRGGDRIRGDEACSALCRRRVSQRTRRVFHHALDAKQHVDGAPGEHGRTHSGF